MMRRRNRRQGLFPLASTVVIALGLLGIVDARGADLAPSQEYRPAAIQPVQVAPLEHPRFTIIGENDGVILTPTDRYYTQGELLSFLSAPIASAAFDWLFPSTFTNPAAARLRKFEIVVGQS